MRRLLIFVDRGVLTQFAACGPECTMLDFQARGIQELDPQVLTGMPRVQILDLRGNKLTGFPSLALPALVELLLEDNELVEFPWLALLHAPKLTRLWLAGNPLGCLPTGPERLQLLGLRRLERALPACEKSELEFLSASTQVVDLGSTCATEDGMGTRTCDATSSDFSMASAALVEESGVQTMAHCVGDNRVQEQTWWRVDLGTRSYVHNIKIENHHYHNFGPDFWNFASSFSGEGFRVFVSDDGADLNAILYREDPCHVQPPLPSVCFGCDEDHQFDVLCEARGRYLWVIPQKSLLLCSVHVFGYRLGCSFVIDSASKVLYREGECELSLSSVSFSGHHIKHLDPDAFRGVGSLTSLDLSNNNISSLPVGMFQHQALLTHLDLSYNMLDESAIAFGALAGLDSLVELDLSYNRFTSPRVGLLADLHSLPSILLDGNLLVCAPAVPWRDHVSAAHLGSLPECADLDPWHPIPRETQLAVTCAVGDASVEECGSWESPPECTPVDAASAESGWWRFDLGSASEVAAFTPRYTPSAAGAGLELVVGNSTRPAPTDPVCALDGEGVLSGPCSREGRYLHLRANSTGLCAWSVVGAGAGRLCAGCEFWVDEDRVLRRSGQCSEACRSLSFQGQNIRSVDAAAFDGLEALEALDLSNLTHSKVYLAPGTFGGLAHLKLLNLSNNHLSGRDFDLQGLSSLVSLDVSGNAIDSEALSSLLASDDAPSLRTVYARGNPLLCKPWRYGWDLAWPNFSDVPMCDSALPEFLPSGIVDCKFWWSHETQDVTREGSCISWFEVDVRVLPEAWWILDARRFLLAMLVGMPRLTSLVVTEMCVDQASFWILETLKSLQRLEVLHLPQQCYLPDHLALPSTLQELRLQGFASASIPVDLSTLPSLELLDLSHNSLTTVPALQHLSMLDHIFMADNILNVIETGVFSNLSLSTLVLDNSRITSIEPNAFAGASIDLLVLDANRIATLDNRTFGGISLLAKLSCKSSHVVMSIEPGAFREQPFAAHIRELVLSGNQLAGIPADELLGMAQLEKLDLDNNLLTTLPRLDGLTQLTSLSVGGNSLVDMASALPPSITHLGFGNSRLRAHHLHNFVSLSVDGLDLANNNFTTLTAGILAGIVVNGRLNLTACSIQTIVPGAFWGASVEVLELEANLITALEPKTFAGIENLQELSLARNRIASIAPGAFGGLDLLQKLVLHSNLLQTLHPVVFDLQLPAIVSVDVRKNQWWCLPNFNFARCAGCSLYVQIYIDPDLLQLPGCLPDGCAHHLSSAVIEGSLDGQQVWMKSLVTVMQALRPDVTAAMHAMQHAQSIYAEGFDGQVCFCVETVECFDVATHLHLQAAVASPVIPDLSEPSAPSDATDQDDSDTSDDTTIAIASACAAAGGLGLSAALQAYRRKRRRQQQPEEAPPLPCLLVFEGQEQVGVVRFSPGERVAFGRGEAGFPCRLEHESCSKLHAAVRLDAAGSSLAVTDEHSTNGTRVDGREVPAGEQVPLRTGQRLVLGASQTVFLVAELRSPPPPPPTEVPGAGEPRAPGPGPPSGHAGYRQRPRERAAAVRSGTATPVVEGWSEAGSGGATPAEALAAEPASKLRPWDRPGALGEGADAGGAALVAELVLAVQPISAAVPKPGSGGTSSSQADDGV